MTPPKDATAPNLRARCKAFYQQQSRNAMLRQGDPVEDLLAFVVAEMGRTADERLADAAPLCLYFPTAEDRGEFIELVREAKPGMTMKEMP
jgi:hypothetical protein